MKSGDSTPALDSCAVSSLRHQWNKWVLTSRQTVNESPSNGRRSASHEVSGGDIDDEATQLSNFRQAGFTGTPRWSPNRRRIVFDSRVSGKPALYLVDPATALPKQIPTNNISGLRAKLVAGRQVDLLHLESGGIGRTRFSLPGGS